MTEALHSTPALRPREQRLFELATENFPNLSPDEQRVLVARTLWTKNPSPDNVARLKELLGVRSGKSFYDRIYLVDDDPDLIAAYSQLNSLSRVDYRKRKPSPAQSSPNDPPYLFTDPALYKAVIYQKVEQLAKGGKKETTIASRLGISTSQAKSIRNFFAELGYLPEMYGFGGLAATHKDEMIESLKAGVPSRILAEEIGTTPRHITFLAGHFRNGGFLDPEILEKASQLAPTLTGRLQYVPENGLCDDPFKDKKLSVAKGDGLTAKEIYQRILELSNQGKGGSEIANEVGTTVNRVRGIRSFLIQSGLVRPRCVINTGEKKGQIELYVGEICQLLREGLTYQEISASLEVDYGTVKKISAHIKNSGMLDADGQSNS